MNWTISPERLARGLYWQEAWKLVEGCTHVSAGCDRCWSAKETKARAAHPNAKISIPKQGLVKGMSFNGKIRLREDNLDKPLRRKKPTVYAIWNDLFHEDVPDDFIDSVFGRMSLCPQHVFLVLTKRAKRMSKYLSDNEDSPNYRWPKIEVSARKFWFNKTRQIIKGKILIGPLPNIIVGGSVEDQKTADERIPILLQTPAAKRFVSYEPTLGLVDFKEIKTILTESPLSYDQIDSLDHDEAAEYRAAGYPDSNALDWIIMGGETGPGARPMNLDWARKTRDDCKAAGVPFFFKSGLLDGKEWKELPR